MILWQWIISKNFLIIRFHIVKKIEDCLKGANCCVILTEWDDYKKLKTNVFRKNMKELNIIDTRRILDPTKFTEFNFKAIGLGPRKDY